jgi:hypothetical protein
MAVRVSSSRVLSGGAASNEVQQKIKNKASINLFFIKRAREYNFVKREQ